MHNNGTYPENYLRRREDDREWMLLNAIAKEDQKKKGNVRRRSRKLVTLGREEERVKIDWDTLSCIIKSLY